MKQQIRKVSFEKTIPWLAGAGIGLGHILMTSHCSLPSQGRCSSCGSCAIAIISIASWAIFKNRQKTPDS